MTSPSTAVQTRLGVWMVLLAGSCLAAGPVHAGSTDSQIMELPFSAFFKRPIGPRGLEPSAALRLADGQRVSLQGYMVSREQAEPGRFLLTPRPVRLSEHADGEADDLPPGTVTVMLDTSQSRRIVAHQAGLLVLTGRFQLGRLEEADGRVSWFRLMLDPDALAADRSTSPRADTHTSLPEPRIPTRP